MYPWSEEEVQVFMQQNLVLRVSSAEVLEKRVCQGHDLIHLLVTLYQGRTTHTKMKCSYKEGSTESETLAVWVVTHLLVGDLQQVQHCSVGPHILK